MFCCNEFVLKLTFMGIDFFSLKLVNRTQEMGYGHTTIMSNIIQRCLITSMKTMEKRDRGVYALHFVLIQVLKMHGTFTAKHAEQPNQMFFF